MYEIASISLYIGDSIIVVSRLFTECLLELYVNGRSKLPSNRPIELRIHGCRRRATSDGQHKKVMFERLLLHCMYSFVASFILN